MQVYFTFLGDLEWCPFIARCLCCSWQLLLNYTVLPATVSSVMMYLYTWFYACKT